MHHTILIVEDQAVVALDYARVISAQGFETRIAASGEEAIEAVRRDERIDLIVMDIDLGPGIDGSETARRVHVIRYVPVVFVSAHVTRDAVSRAESVARYGYVPKSAGPHVLLSTIRMAYDLAEQSNRYSDAIVRAIPDPVFRFDREGTFLSNPSGSPERLYAPPELFLGRRARDVMPGTIGHVLEERIAAALESGNVQFHEYTLEEENDVRHYESRIVPFDPDSVLAIVRDVTEWRQAVARVESLLEEQRMLMRESQHRVKNDMFLVKSLLALQAQQTVSGEARDVLEDSAHRIDVMRRIYEMLYLSPPGSEIAMRPFLCGLVEDIRAAGSLFPVVVDCSVDETALPSIVAVPIGIIVNELLVNALKHAFADPHDARIEVLLEQRSADGVIYVEVRDNGIGITAPGTDDGPGFGMVMVEALANQVGGSLAFRNDGGTIVSVVVPTAWYTNGKLSTV